MALLKGAREFRRHLDILATKRSAKVVETGFTGSGHVYFNVRKANQDLCKIIISASPSDGNWMRYALRDAKKVIGSEEHANG
jgi:hypothetical protein